VAGLYDAAGKLTPRRTVGLVVLCALLATAVYFLVHDCAVGGAMGVAIHSVDNSYFGVSDVRRSLPLGVVLGPPGWPRTWRTFVARVRCEVMR